MLYLAQICQLVCISFTCQLVKLSKFLSYCVLKFQLVWNTMYIRVQTALCLFICYGFFCNSWEQVPMDSCVATFNWNAKCGRGFSFYTWTSCLKCIFIATLPTLFIYLLDHMLGDLWELSSVCRLLYSAALLFIVGPSCLYLMLGILHNMSS